MVRIPSLKEFSNLIPKNVKNKVIENKEIIKIKIVKKYLLMSDFLVLELNKKNLFIYI
tara:strand:+ start:373 stop:546 length:174 start_codon:yes stop_codon:yes gene_type:complete